MILSIFIYFVFVHDFKEIEYDAMNTGL